MMPQGKQLVLSLRQSVPATTVKPFSFNTIGGYIDYTAIGVSVSDAGNFFDNIYSPCLFFCRKVFGLTTSGGTAGL